MLYPTSPPELPTVSVLDQSSVLAARQDGRSDSRDTYAPRLPALRRFDGSVYPETDAGIAAYLTGLYEEGRSAACAVMAVAALRFRAKLYERPSPVGAAVMAERSGGVAGLRDAAILAVASDALLRVSEVSALDIQDVDIEEQTVLIRRSKTGQEGRGSVQFLGKPTAKRIRAWLAGSGLTEGALFRAVYQGGRVRGGRLSDRSIRRIITRWGRAAGVDGRVSGHSLRVGGAQSLASAGASLVEMQLAGRWRSPAMPGRYVQGQPAEQGAVKRLRYGR